MSRFNTSYRGIGQFLVSEEMQAAMLELAKKVEHRAIETAPDAEPLGVGFRSHFSTEVGVRVSKDRHRRACGRVTNDDPDAFFIEMGTQEGVDRTGRKHGATPRHRTLGRALDILNE